jgi:UDP-2-acetamido-2-deoxy-ribo-hexuluronate aminotransferase
LFGQSADIESIIALAQKYNSYVIEDNAQALGSNYTFADGHTQKTGTMGQLAAPLFSLPKT